MAQTGHMSELQKLEVKVEQVSVEEFRKLEALVASLIQKLGEHGISF